MKTPDKEKGMAGKMIISLLIFILLHFAAKAENTMEPDAPEANDSRITGNWGGARDVLENSGIEVNFVYKGEVWGTKANQNLKSCYTDNFDITAMIDFEKMLGLGYTGLFAHVLGNHGSNIADEAGAAQGISNIAAFNTWKLFELYIETALFDNILNILVGMYDLNTQFDCKTVNQLFINPSHGIGADWAQSGKNGPSIFPTSSFGFRARVSPVDNMYLQFSALDGVSGDPNRPNGTHIILKPEDGLLSAFEIGYSRGNKSDCLPGNEKCKNEPFTKFALGYWHYTDNYSRLFSGINNWGIYFLFEQDIYNKHHKTDEGLSIAGRVGIADDEANRFDAYIGAGLIYKGIFAGDYPDELGIAIASAHNTYSFRKSGEAAGSEVNAFEHIVELTYKYFLTEALAVQPDMQYVINPYNKKSGSGAFVFGARVITVF